MTRDEDGAIAIMVSVLAVVLLSVAALTVDLGRAFVERRDVQKVADHAALAAGATGNLPGTAGGSCAYGTKASPLDRGVLDAAAFLGSAPWSGGPSASSLTDCSLSNGEVVYGRMTYPAGTPTLAFDPATVSVISPSRTVEFGLAAVMGASSVDVAGAATAAVGTPGANKIIPSYAISGCDWGAQTITDPAAGQSSNITPTLAFPNDVNAVTLEATSATAPNPYPASIDVDPGVGTTVTLRGSNLDRITAVGFFREVQGAETTPPAPHVVAKSDPGSSWSDHADGSISFVLPPATDTAHPLHDVVDSDQLWWLRVKGPVQNANDTTLAWSNVVRSGSTATRPFRVGSAYLRCVGASNEGNYGTLILPRTDSSDNSSTGWLPRNIAANLQPPLTLHTYPGAPTTVGGASTAPSLCDLTDTRTIYSTTTGTPVLRRNTNCVDTDPGLPANSVSVGLVEGIGSVGSPGRVDGRLATAAPSSCGGRPNRTVTLSGNRSYTINDDALSCYLKPGYTVGQIASAAYSGGEALECGLFSSPRFFYQPVLQVEPSGGGSQHYAIVDFRPAFITEQVLTADSTTTATTTDNGIRVFNGAVQQVDVVFFNNRAVPDSCPDAFGPSLGGTTKQIVRLVD